MGLTGRLALTMMLAARATTAQQGSVQGSVYDSLARAPLAGAVVQVMLVDSVLPSGARAPASRSYVATTDASGHYRIEGVPRGRFGIGFQHEALTVLGLESPVRAFQLGADTTVVVDLAIPPASMVRTMACAQPGSAADGMLVGLLMDAARGATIVGGSVTLGWVEIGVVDGRMRPVPKRVVATSDEGGAFRACGVATASPLTVLVTMPGFRDVTGELTVAEGAVLRQDFRLADTAAHAGGGRVSGRIVHDNGAPLSAGRVSIDPLELDAEVTDGAYTLTGVRAGTWLLEVRALGYEPRSQFVDVSENATTTVSLSLGPKVQLLEAVNVIGKASPDIKALTGIAERSRRAWGTTFLPGNTWLRSALEPKDVLGAARGFIGGGPRGCAEQGSRGKHMEAFLDGVPFAAGLDAIGNLVPMRDILAIETYPDAHSVPAEYRGANVCAAVFVWTKH